MESLDKNKLILLGIAAVVVVVLLARKSSGSSSPTVIPSTAGDTQLSQMALQADTYKSVLSADLERYRITKDSEIASKSADIAREIGLSTADKALQAETVRAASDKDIALATLNAQLQGLLSSNTSQQQIANMNTATQLEAQRIANATATQQAQLQSDAIRAQANAQRNASIFGSIISIGGSIISSILNRRNTSSGTITIPGTGGKGGFSFGF